MRVTGRVAGFKAIRLNVITKEKRVEREKPRAEQLLGHQHEEVTCKGDQEGATNRAEGKPIEG